MDKHKSQSSTISDAAPPGFSGVLETSLYVDDLEKAELFYGHILGLLKIFSVPGRQLAFRCQDGVLLIFKPEQTEREQIVINGGAIPLHGAHGPGLALISGFRFASSALVMSFFVVDVEADGPIPAEYSMVCFGAVLFDEALDESFYGQTRPISDRFVPEALAVSGFSREQHLTFDDPKSVMEKFANWLDEHSKGRPVFVSDNLAFDWQFINYYFHRFLGHNPFGFSGRRIGDLYAGLVKDAHKATEWKKYRITEHTHNPVDDARGNAEALKRLRELGLKI